MRAPLHLVPATPPARLRPRVVPVLLGVGLALASALPLLLTATP